MDRDPVAQGVVSVFGNQVAVLLLDLPEPVKRVPLVLIIGRVAGQVAGGVVGQAVVVARRARVRIEVARADLVDRVESLRVVPFAGAGQ